MVGDHTEHERGKSGIGLFEDLTNPMYSHIVKGSIA